MNEATVTPRLSTLFDNYRRVVYANNPLVEVILQVRFPTLLRLQSESPSAFQEKILAEYPHYELEEMLEMKPPTSVGGPPTLVELKLHRFLSADRYWKIALGADSISLSTKSYERWEGFKDRSRFCLAAFFGLYPIKVVTRIGLRYRDLIRPSALGKAGREWSTLINPSVLGPMGSGEFRSFPFESARWSQRFAVDEVRVNFQGGLRTQDGEKCYYLDCDMYLLKEVIADDDLLQPELERLHSPVGPLFKWAITDELHESLGPNPV